MFSVNMPDASGPRTVELYPYYHPVKALYPRSAVSMTFVQAMMI